MKKKNDKFLIVIITIVLLILICAIMAAVLLFVNQEDIQESEENAQESVVEEITEDDIDKYEGPYSNETYANMLEEVFEYELISVEEVPIVYTERHADYDSSLPPYLQEYVPRSAQMEETIQPIIEQVQEEQTYLADLWQKVSASTAGYRIEITYQVQLSTEYHFWKFVAGIDDETTDGSCVVQVFKKVVIPTVE